MASLDANPQATDFDRDTSDPLLALTGRRRY